MDLFIAVLSDKLPEFQSSEEAVSWFQKMIPEFLAWGKSFLFSLAGKLVLAFLAYLIGRRLIKWVKRLLDRSLKRASVDEGVQKFLNSLVGIVTSIFLAIVIIRILGVETSSFAAVIGSAGLTLGLALQGSLSNFAGGVLILMMKPFRIGDYIIVNTLEGTVTGIDIFYTRLLTVDNRKVVIPNGGLSNSSIINVTNEEVRRLDITVPVSYDCNIGKVKKILASLVADHAMVLKEEQPAIYVDAFLDSSISIGLRVWTKKEDYWPLKWELLEQIKEAFDEQGIAIPFNQLDVTIKNSSIN